jgi:two-component system cell cycle sensor histidine kinase/response regulator CckA
LVSSNAKIMIVDDEPDILSVTRMCIESCGYASEGFTSPLKALEKFRENPYDFSLVLVDIRMPGMTGVELAQEIMKIKSDVPIVLMTAFNVDESVFSSLPMIRKEDIVRKPFSPIDLCNTVKVRLQK